MDNRDYEKALDKCWNKLCESKPTLSRQAGVLTLFNFIFDYIHHNLTSDAEGEEDEMLHVSRKKLQYFYEKLRKVGENHAAFALQSLFGSKCLTDETVTDCHQLQEPKPAEPKFKVGDYVWYRGEVRKVAATTENNRYYLTGITESVSASDLEHYQQPFSKVKEYAAYDSNGIDRFGQQFDGTSTAAHSKTDDHFADASKMIRLNIAAMMAQGLLSNGCGFCIDDKSVDKTPENIAEAALLFADALINEAEKGSEE